jgi:hypothetical protein
MRLSLLAEKASDSNNLLGMGWYHSVALYDLFPVPQICPFPGQVYNNRPPQKRFQIGYEYWVDNGYFPRTCLVEESLRRLEQQPLIGCPHITVELGILTVKKK